MHAFDSLDQIEAVLSGSSSATTCGGSAPARQKGPVHAAARWRRAADVARRDGAELRRAAAAGPPAVLAAKSSLEKSDCAGGGGAELRERLVP